jgi:hypothetical protein
MQRLWSFIKYNNAIPIGLFILFGMSGAAFAASPEVQQAVYSSQDSVKSVDNTYLLSADLSNYDFSLRITDVTEDADKYYVAYTYDTIQVQDYVWQNISVNKTMTVSKVEIQGRDLGLFVAEQLGQEMANQLAYLTEVQKKEKQKGASLKTVATVYSGLVGRMLGPSEKTFPGYTPVITPPPPTGRSTSTLAVAGSSGQIHISLPSMPSTNDIKSLVDAAVRAALAKQSATSTPPDSGIAANEPADTTPPASDASAPPDTSASSTPPVDAGTTPPAEATTTPPVTEPPPDTSASSTPPVDAGTTLPPADATTTPPADTTAPSSDTPPSSDTTASTPPPPPADAGSTTTPAQ